MTLSEINYEGRIPVERLGNLIHGWGQILSLGMGGNAYCTPKYYTWYRLEGIIAQPSLKSLQGLADIHRTDQIRDQLLHLSPVTTAMYEQVIPGSMDNLIPAVDDELEEEMEKDPEEDPKKIEEDPEKDPEEDPEEDLEEEPMEEQDGELTEEIEKDLEEEEYGPIYFGRADEDF
ncbi:protein SHORT ROOT IN SALT MEDIUM 1-like [Capsicum galapagoense]